MHLSRYLPTIACALIGTGLVVPSGAQQPTSRTGAGAGRVEPTQAQAFPDYVCGSSPSRWRETPKTGVQMNGVPAKDQMVAKFAPDGRVKAIWMFPVGVSKPGDLDWVHGIAVDAHGDLYLGDIRGKRVQKFAFEPAIRPVRPTGSR
jgi:hypothetical protein